MATKPQRNGKRRPVEFVAHPDTGAPVDGLRHHKASGLYYRIEAKREGEKRARIHYYPQHALKGVAYLRRAIFEHDCHRKGVAPAPALATIPIDAPLPVYDAIGGNVVESLAVTLYDDAGNAKTVLPVRKSDLVRYFREVLLDPVLRKDWATSMGVPELAYLERLRPSELSLTLAAIGDLYLNKKPPLHHRYKRDATAFWQEFCETVNVERVSQLTAEHFKSYRETIYHDGKDKSPSYVNNRFTLVVSVFRFAQTEGEDTDNLNRALGFCRMLRRMKKSDVNPQPISRKDYEKLFAAADTKWRAILLLALNAAYYPVDVAQVRKVSIDLAKKTLCETRTKTGIPRIAVLWDRTVKAIRDYLKEQPHDGETLFLSEIEKPFTPKQIARYFREELSAKAGVKGVSFDQIRDGAQTAAIEGGADEQHAEMLLGHRAGGTKDNYTKRNPMMVADACAAIDKAYFGGQKKGGKK